MITEFDALSESEVELMHKAPILVCIMVAGADNHIDQREMEEAISLAKKKSKKHKSLLKEYYTTVGEDFEDKIKIIVQGFPVEAEQRNVLIMKELELINVILPKVEKSFAIQFYESLREIAQKIAESSGGMLWMNSIGEEEAKFVSLPMIKNPAIS
ncbi:MAG: hypothetical protein JJE09_04255 [Bacteroidia bacterium]|nr:hypothetical protein [Bacteroidia bacterium]